MVKNIRRNPSNIGPLNRIINGFYIDSLVVNTLRNSTYLIKLTKGDDKDSLLVILNRVTNSIQGSPNLLFVINYNLIEGNYTIDGSSTIYINDINTNITFFQITKQLTIGNKIYLNPDINMYNYYKDMQPVPLKLDTRPATYDEFVSKYTGIVNIYIAKRRIRIPLKITQLDNKIDGKSIE